LKNTRSRALRHAVAYLAVFAALTVPAAAAEEVNVYTYREPALIKPLFDAFTKSSGVKVNILFASQGLEQRIAAEGANSPADLLLTTDISRLLQAGELGITQPVKSPVLEAAIPASYRDPEGRWFGVSARGRVVYASKDRVTQDSMTYENLADPKWRGKICSRSGQHIYNNALIAAVIAHNGEDQAAGWLAGVKANLARKPSGGDREVARDIAAGQCDIGLGNTYYVALMLNREADRKPWAEAIKVIMPTFDGGGTHVNVSGFVVAKNAPNRANAVRLGEWLVSEEAQGLYAAINYEYPVRPGVALNPTVASFGPIAPDTLPLVEIAKHRRTAGILVDKVGFDN